MASDPAMINFTAQMAQYSIYWNRVNKMIYANSD